MYILLTGNSRYLFTGRDALGAPLWVEPYEAGDTIQPTLFTHRAIAERVRDTFPEPLRSETEICALITPF